MKKCQLVGSPLKEIEKWSPFLRVARTREEWVKGLEEALSEDRGLYEHLAREDWSAKAREFLNICLSHA